MQLEYALRTEIEFWRDMIETRPAGAAGKAVEAMFQSKSLAEEKLDLLLRNEERIIQ